MLINIEQVELLKEDDRGKNYGFSARESKYFIVLHRKAGSVSGNHYHKGTIKSKSPEILYLISGTIDLTVWDDTGNEEHYTLSEGTKLETPPNIYHRVEAKTDCIMMEFNTDQKDFSGYEGDTIKSEQL